MTDFLGRRLEEEEEEEEDRLPKDEAMDRLVPVFEMAGA